MERKGRWLDFLRQQRQQGIDRHRVRVLRAHRGDDIRILDLAERGLPVGTLDHDFWLVDHKHPVRMHYDDAGRFLGATVVDPVELDRYQAAARRSLACGRTV